MEGLGGVGGDGGKIPLLQDAPAVSRLPEGMGGIIDHKEVMLFGNLPDCLRVTQGSVDMHREDACRVFGDSAPYCLRGEGQGDGIHVCKDGPVSCPQDCLCRGGEGKGGCDHLLFLRIPAEVFPPASARTRGFCFARLFCLLLFFFPLPHAKECEVQGHVSAGDRLAAGDAGVFQ